jgi:hypothetical protein
VIKDVYHHCLADFSKIFTGIFCTVVLNFSQCCVTIVITLVLVFPYRNAAHGFSLIQVDNTKVTMKEILLKAVKRRKGSQKISGALVKLYHSHK